MLCKIFGYFAPVAVVLLHAHGQSLYAAQNQPALKRRQEWPPRILKKSKLLRLLGLRAHHHSSESVAVAIEKFRGGVDDHIRAEFDGTLKIRRHESVVDDDLNTVPVAQIADGAKVAKFHQRIGGRLQKQAGACFSEMRAQLC